MPNGRVILFYLCISALAGFFLFLVVPFLKRFTKDWFKLYKVEDEALNKEPEVVEEVVVKPKSRRKGKK